MHRILPTAFSLIAVLLGLARAADVRVNGLDPKEEIELFTLIGPRLEFTLNRPASAARADDAAFLIERVLVRRGFYRAKATGRAAADGSVILVDVEKGPRILLGDVYLSSPAPLPTDDIAEYFYQPITDRELVKRENAPYLEDYPEEGVANITSYLQSLGYWKAQARLTGSKFRDDNRVDFNIRVVAGPLHRMRPVRFVLHGPGPDLTPLRSELSEGDGKTATTPVIDRIRPKVEEFFRQEGYEFAEYQVRAESSGGFMEVIIEVWPGKLHYIGDPIISGLERTDPQRFERHFRALRGELYDGTRIDSLVRRYLATGAFESLTVEPVPASVGDDVLNLSITAREGMARGYRYYIGAGSVEGPVLGASYYDRNYLGKLYNLSTKLEFSGLGPLADVSLTDPFFAGENITFTSRFFIRRAAYEEYDKEETGLSTNWSYDFTDFYTATAFTSLDYTYITDSPLPGSAIGQGEYLAFSLGTTHEFDWRDNPTLPTSGVYGKLDIAFTQIFGSESSTQILTGEGGIAYIHSFNPENRIGVAARGGLIFPIGDSTEVPIDERFFLGGPDTIRSFAWRDLGPRPPGGTPNLSTGGEAYWVLNAEYVRKIKGPFSWVAFTDAGSLSQTYNDLPSADIEVAAGLGVWIELPIGPIRFEYAHNLTKDNNDPSGTWHFAIGIAF